MKPNELMIRCLAMREGDQWVAICLPFDLAAQADTLPAVKQALRSQILSYLTDALVGQDRPKAGYLLGRRAPLRYWCMYWIAGAARWLHTTVACRAFRTPVPLAPAC